MVLMAKPGVSITGEALVMDGTTVVGVYEGETTGETEVPHEPD
jgi:hypothetical protein